MKKESLKGHLARTFASPALCTPFLRWSDRCYFEHIPTLRSELTQKRIGARKNVAVSAGKSISTGENHAWGCCHMGSKGRRWTFGGCRVDIRVNLRLMIFKLNLLVKIIDYQWDTPMLTEADKLSTATRPTNLTNVMTISKHRQTDVISPWHKYKQVIIVNVLKLTQNQEKKRGPPKEMRIDDMKYMDGWKEELRTYKWC